MAQALASITSRQWSAVSPGWSPWLATGQASAVLQWDSCWRAGLWLSSLWKHWPVVASMLWISCFPWVGFIEKHDLLTMVEVRFVISSLSLFCTLGKQLSTFLVEHGYAANTIVNVTPTEQEISESASYVLYLTIQFQIRLQSRAVTYGSKLGRITWHPCYTAQFAVMYLIYTHLFGSIKSHEGNYVCIQRLYRYPG